MLKSFPYWRNLLPSSAGSYYLTLYMQSGANSYMISMCDVACITETSMPPIFIYLNAEVPSGAYNVAIGLSSIGLIGTLQRAVAGGFSPLSASFIPITIVSLNEEVSNLFKNMVFTITAITANKSPEGGGFYTYSMSSIKVKVKNNNASAVPLFITEGFVMSGTSKQSTMPSTGSTNFTVPAGEEVTVTYTFSNLYLYIQSSVGKAGVTFKMYDASSITSTISQNIS